MLHGDSHSHSSFSTNFTRCFALQLLLRGEYCSLCHLHTATVVQLEACRSKSEHSTYISSCSSENVCSPESTLQPIAVRMVEWSRHVEYVRVTSKPHCHHRRQTCIGPLTITGNRLLFTSSGSRSRWFPRRSGKANALRRTLHTARRPGIVRRCSRALLGACRCSRARLSHAGPTSSTLHQQSTRTSKNNGFQLPHSSHCRSTHATAKTPHTTNHAPSCHLPQPANSRANTPRNETRA